MHTLTRLFASLSYFIISGTVFNVIFESSSIGVLFEHGGMEGAVNDVGVGHGGS
jgi:hypothetical protein